MTAELSSDRQESIRLAVGAARTVAHLMDAASLRALAVAVDALRGEAGSDALIAAWQSVGGRRASIAVDWAARAAEAACAGWPDQAREAAARAIGHRAYRAAGGTDHPGYGEHGPCAGITTAERAAEAAYVAALAAMPE